MIAAFTVNPHLATKTKRPRFSQKYRNDGIRLASLLREQQKEFPRFAPYIDEFIQRINQEAKRTREGDRERVLAVLREFQESGVFITEIVTDTGLTKWDVRQILDDLIKSGKVVEIAERRPRLSPACWRRIYKLAR